MTMRCVEMRYALAASSGQHWPQAGRIAHKYPASWFADHMTWDREFVHNDTGEAFRCEEFREFPSKFGAVIDVVRILRLSSGLVNFDDVGMHWSWELQHWHPWEGKPVRPPFMKEPLEALVLIRARLKRSEVDWNETAFQNLVYSFSEKELVPNASACLDVLDVRRLSVDSVTGNLLEGDNVEHPSIARVRT